MGVQAMLVSKVFATVNTDVRTLACVGAEKREENKIIIYVMSHNNNSAKSCKWLTCVNSRVRRQMMFQ